MLRETTMRLWVVLLVPAAAALVGISAERVARTQETEGAWNHIWEKAPLGAGGSLLGEPCVVNKNCAVTNGQCEKGRCLCVPHYLALNASLCLPGALVGFPCVVDAQCSMRVANTACIQGYCRCGASYVPYRRNNCLKGARVGDMCRSHQQCQEGNRDSFCNFTVPRVYGRCQCSSDAPTHGKTCGHLRYSLGSPCGTTAQCSSQVLGSVCVIQNSAQLQALTDISANSITAIPGIPPTPLGVPLAVCACPPGHLVAENGTRCIPVLKDAGVIPVSLGERCESSNQCRASDPFTFCRAGVCHCLYDTSECSAKNRGCHKETFQCASSGRCISWYFVCNGERDCEDGSDEASCLPHRCPELAHTCADGTCISRAHLCDGKPHCPDGSDEASCNETCPATTFRCGDGRCLPGFVFCNAKPTCSDGSDEDEAACIQGSITASYCPFRCGNGRCRSTAVLCSGTDGCGDNTDEAKCSVCSCRRPS
nr:prolow-density lipoprotein receptor-related protein 1-like [Procambarus clarkii]